MASKSVGIAVAQVAGMSLLRVFVSTLPLALILGCATKPVPSAAAPQCEAEPVITVNDPEPPESMVSIPVDTELVSLRLFVVSQGEGASDEDLPAPIRASGLCEADGCHLLLSPTLLGRNRRELALDVGNTKSDHVFKMKAHPSVVGEHVELQLEAQFHVSGDPIGQRFAFAGTLEPGQITHVGTFYADGRSGHTVGPQVFAVVERASSDPE